MTLFSPLLLLLGVALGAVTELGHPAAVMGGLEVVEIVLAPVLLAVAGILLLSLPLKEITAVLG
jgi:hypothetical protein